MNETQKQADSCTMIILSLCGYDHETDNGEMNRRELKLRRMLKITK